MSTHATPESRHAPSLDRPTDSESDASEAGTAPDAFDTHDAAATFGASDYRLPNTIDRENKHVG
jgi:hypothetical protein